MNEVIAIQSDYQRYYYPCIRSHSAPSQQLLERQGERAPHKLFHTDFTFYELEPDACTRCCDTNATELNMYASVTMATSHHSTTQQPRGGKAIRCSSSCPIDLVQYRKVNAVREQCRMPPLSAAVVGGGGCHANEHAAIVADSTAALIVHHSSPPANN